MFPTLCAGANPPNVRERLVWRSTKNLTLPIVLNRHWQELANQCLAISLKCCAAMVEIQLLATPRNKDRALVRGHDMGLAL